jgi:hypothetical protein
VEEEKGGKNEKGTGRNKKEENVFKKKVGEKKEEKDKEKTK